MTDAAGHAWPDVLTLPRPPARLVARPALERKLDRLAPVTVVEALPGFGKTTVGVAWARRLREDGTPVIWIQARRDLDDPVRLMDVVRHGLRMSGADALLGSRTRVMVVIDEAHLLRDPAVADALVRMVKQHQRLHVAALTAPVHPLTDVAARHSVETNVLGASHLGIPADEVISFAQAWGHELSEQSARVLHRLVGGWLLPLRLVLDATPTWSADFATHAAHDFLTEQVLPGIADPDELTRAVRWAVPDGLDLELASAMLDDGSDAATVQSQLVALERKGLLWRQPSRAATMRWRYPTLLRRALLNRLEESPDVARAHHLLAARAFAARSGPAAAAGMLCHARAAGDWSLLAELWVDRGWSLVSGEAASFQAAYAGIPAAAVRDNPHLSLPASLGDAMATTSEDTDAMRRVEALLRRYTEVGSDLLRRREVAGGPGMAAELLTATMIARRTEGNLDEARKLGSAAATELRRARLSEQGRQRSSQAAWFHLQNAITQLHSSRYEEAFREATTAYQIEPRTIVGAGAAGLLAAVQAFHGMTALARQWLEAHEVVDIAGHWAAGLALLPARLTRAVLALDRLDAEGARAELAQVQLGPESSGLWPLILLTHHRLALLFGDPVAMLSQLEHVTRVLARHIRYDGSLADQAVGRCRVDLLLALGEVNRVQPLLPENGPPWLLAPRARLHLVTGRHDAAARIAAAAVWREDIAVRDRLELLVVSALALREQGKVDRAVESFRRAHALYLDIGSLQPLLLMSPETRGDLLEASGLELTPEEIERLDGRGQIYPEHAELIALSPREVEVLRHMGHHDTTASLARSLNVSVNTVKKQLVSLYAKLGVNDRSSALLRAAALGLIEDRVHSGPGTE